MAIIPPDPSATSTSGVLLIGGLISFWLYGIQTLQAYIYYSRYPEDSRYLKFMVAFLMLVDTLHTAFTGHMLYYFLVEEAGQAGMRPKAWSFNSNIALTAIIAFICQCFLAWRIWILNRVWWQRMAALIIATIALIPLACGLACTIIMVFIRHPDLYAHCTTIIGTWLASTAAIDVVLATLLSLTLHRSRTGIPQTDHIIGKLITVAINTAVLTAGLALSDLATFEALGNTNLIHWAINLSIGKSFVNTTLASLNARRRHGAATNTVVSSNGTVLRCSASAHETSSYGESAGTNSRIVFQAREFEHGEYAAGDYQDANHSVVFVEEAKGITHENIMDA